MLDNGLYVQLTEVCFAKIEMRADYRDQGGDRRRAIKERIAIECIANVRGLGTYFE